MDPWPEVPSQSAEASHSPPEAPIAGSKVIVIGSSYKKHADHTLHSTVRHRTLEASKLTNELACGKRLNPGGKLIVFPSRVDHV